MKNEPIFRKFWFFCGFFELCIGLIFVGYPALVMEYLYPHYTLLGVELSLIQIGWMHVGLGFWNTYLLYQFTHLPSVLASLSLIWSISLFKDLWSIWWLISWQVGWGGVWHLIHIGLCAGLWIQLKRSSVKSFSNPT